MRNVAKILIAIGLIMLSFYLIYYYSLNKKETQSIETYIEETNIIEEEVIEEEPVVEKKEVKKVEIDYKAVLEMPSINLKNGLVNSTKNFNSINYAISIDKNSKYPNEYGNFILYAHSGSSRVSFFKNLNKVQIGNEVYVYYNGTKYIYKIFDKHEIEKSGKAKIVKTNDKKLITMITCISHTNKQVVLIGEQINSEQY